MCSASRMANATIVRARLSPLATSVEHTLRGRFLRDRSCSLHCTRICTRMDPGTPGVKAWNGLDIPGLGVFRSRLFLVRWSKRAPAW